MLQTMSTAAIQTISVVSPITTTSGWMLAASLVVLIVSVFAASFWSLFLVLAYRKSNAIQTKLVKASKLQNDLQSKLIEVAKLQHAWLARQDEPQLMAAAAYVTRLLAATGVKRYPGHLGSTDPVTGFSFSLYLHNPGGAVLNILRILVRLEDPFTGWESRVFRPLLQEEREYRYSEFLPRDFKELSLFVNQETTADKPFPEAVVEIEYISGSSTRTLLVHCQPPELGDVATPIPMVLRQETREAE